MNCSRLPALLTLLVAAANNFSGQSFDLFSDDTSLRAGSYRTSEKKINTIKSHFEQILASRSSTGREFSDEQLDLLDEVYQVSEVKKDNCHLEHFKQIQRLINRKAKFHFSTVPFLKYHFWLQFLMCHQELGRQLDQTYETKLSEKQKDDLRLLYDTTTIIRGYAYRLLFDNISKKQAKLLTSVLLNGSATFMKHRGAHIYEILAKHDKDNQFAREHLDIVFNFCTAINEPMRELMDIYNEILVDQPTVWALELEPRPIRVFFLVKICQRIIDYEDKILDLAHKQLLGKSSHLERFLIVCRRRAKNDNN